MTGRIVVYMAHDVMTADQAAEFLQTSRDTLLRKARRGELPAAKLGREWRFRRADLDAWLIEGGDTLRNREAQGDGALRGQSRG